MCRRIYIFIILLIMAATSVIAATRKFTLVIDAGHGGHDAGAIGAISKEKDINLRMALAFGKLIETNCPDVRVIYTRKTDTFVTLYGRAEIANKAKADLFISIHTNSLPKGHKARGFETYTLGMHRAGDNLDVAKRENSVILVEKDYKEHYEGFDPNSSESYIIFEFMQDHNMERSVELSKLIQNNVCSLANRPNKGVKQAGFLVLRETSMPSCLIELGFISTADEEQYLNTSAGVSNISRGIYNAFIAYKQKYDSSSSTRYKAERALTSDTDTDTTKKSPVAEPVKPGRQPDAKPQKASSEVKTASERKAASEVKTTSEQKASSEAKAVFEAKSTVKDAPVFKIQVCTSTSILSPSSRQLKGHNDANYYKEGSLYKYTLGESTNYNEIFRLRKTLLQDFPDCFIIAFKNNEKVNINEAIKEFKANKQ